MSAAAYVHLTPGQAPPRLEGAGFFKAVLVIEDDVTSEWQATVSDWLVLSGCRYMMAWGRKCGEWDDSVDHANLRVFNYGEIPDDESVMTTWHERESLMDTFWFSTHAATHPTLDLMKTYLVHIAPRERSKELLQTFLDAQELV